MNLKLSIKRSWLVAIVIFCLFIASIAYSGSIVNSRHDLTYALSTNPIQMPPYLNNYGEICVYCHTPHSAKSIAPLWNRNTYGESYTLYNSSTMDSSPTQPSGISLACLSCHDGTIAVDEIVNAPGTGANLTGPWYGVNPSGQHLKMSTSLVDGCGTPGCHSPPIAIAHDASFSYLTVDLSDDHPISMAYGDLSAQYGTEFITPDDAQKGWSDIKLFQGKVECPSCHDPHDPDYAPFLRISNANSALCLGCHIK